MADLRNQKPDDYVRQLVDEEFNRERMFVEPAQGMKNEKRKTYEMPSYYGRKEND